MPAPPNERGLAPEGQPDATTKTVTTTIDAKVTSSELIAEVVARAEALATLLDYTAVGRFEISPQIARDLARFARKTASFASQSIATRPRLRVVS